MNELHISTVTNQNSIIELSDSPISKVYVATLTQAGVNNPTVIVLQNDYDFPIVWTRSGVGFYRGDLASAFLFGQTSVLITSTYGTGINVNTYAYNENNNRCVVETVLYNNITNAYDYSDNNLFNSTIHIETFIPITDSESSFSSILSRLDSNQLDMWNKIVVRFDNTVTEIDGAKWRKTGVFATSSKVINS